MFLKDGVRRVGLGICGNFTIHISVCSPLKTDEQVIVC